MTSNLDFQQLYEYEKHQNQLMMGHLGYSKQWLDYQKNSNNIIINHWLAAKLKYDWPTEQVTQWPTAMQQQWHGWRAVVNICLHTTFYSGGLSFWSFIYYIKVNILIFYVILHKFNVNAIICNFKNVVLISENQQSCYKIL